MKTSGMIVTITISFFLVFGCSYKQKAAAPLNKPDAYFYSTPDPVTPVILSHVDIDKKKDYIRNAQRTLLNFLLVARATLEKDDESVRETLGREINRYVELYVEPILKDSAAIRDMETRSESAKLHHAAAYCYYEVKGYYQAKTYLHRLSNRFGPDLLSNIKTDSTYCEKETLAEELKSMQAKISGKLAAINSSY